MREKKKLTSARQLAVRCLLEADKGGYSNLIFKQQAAGAGFSGRDTAFAAALFYGALERRLTLDYILAPLLSRPVGKLDELAGLKVRVMQNNIFIDAFREWGANPVPMPKSELYTALEMKAVDGQENPFIDIETNKMFEVQKYLTASRHAYTPWLILYSKKLWDELSADEKAALREAAVEARKVQREANKSADDKALVELKNRGMVVSELSRQERDKMVEKVKPVYDKNLAAYGKEGPNLAFEALKKIRAN